MLQVTKRLQEGISLVNATDINKVNGLLSRVCASLCSGHSQVFSEEEEQKLSASLGLPVEKTKQLIYTNIHIIQQAAHGMVRPAFLGEQLQACEMTSDKASIFVEHWTTNAKQIVETLRQRSLSAKQLADISWDLHLKTASSGCARQTHPIAHLQLSLSCKEPSSTKMGPMESLVMQFDQDQLYQLYDQMEQIQANLDALR
ncbi:COMM domain-containing protein 10-like isoform X2 [Penaeus japonicus]|uniref:COMM domain-containing protein 10-like isoform X2 n=1 Tax=Penaeus japonicus TaxID=27405 RepID=UPI001C711EE5|nr:COMM domain-containing protein 10-like isoform X2 [Penaeus japonicus]